MSRDVPFDSDEKCDICGKVGAFDFMGDYICSECLKRETEESDAIRKHRCSITEQV